MNKEYYKKLQEGYNVIYPKGDRATYKSILNFSDDLQKPFQRWCRYKEGYSIELVERLIEKYNTNSNGVILDPFLGSGTTIIGANSLGLAGVGFEVNPFSYHLAKCKSCEYSKNDIAELKKCIDFVLTKAKDETIAYTLPALSFSDKVLNSEIEGYYMRIKVAIDSLSVSEKIKSVLSLGWVSKIEEFSNYRKAGNGLKAKRYKTPHLVTIEEVENSLAKLYADMVSDIEGYSADKKATIYNDSCLNMSKIIQNSSISGIIFSPPYANCFDYTEIYKLELWFGQYVKSYADLKSLRQKSLRSNLNGLLMDDNVVSSIYLDELLSELRTKKLWDKRIPLMLQLYFSDMFKVIEQCYGVLERDGFCAIVVGNSAYSGVVFPTDLLLANYAESIGFEVDQILVDRYIITSSQQYEETKVLKDYLRESVVCLRKK